MVVFQGRDSGNRNVAGQAIPMDSYQSHFRKFDIFFPRKQQGEIRTERNIECLLLYHFLHGGNNFRSGYIIFDIFNNWTFYGTVEKTNEK